jgi:hypothetical protein
VRRIATSEQFGRLSLELSKVVTKKYFTKEIYCTQGGIIPVSHFSGLSIYPLQTHLSQLNDWYKRLKWYKAVYQ